MQKIISQIPQLEAFLKKIPKTQHHIALKQIIKLGLQSLLNEHDSKENHNPNIMLQEIDRIKLNLKELNKIVKNQCKCCCICKNNQSQQQYAKNIDEDSNKTYSFKTKNQPNTHNQYPSNNGVTVNPFSKYKSVISKHHLDDTQVKLALNFPKSILSQVRHPSKRKSQQYRKHIYQQQINKQQQVKLKENREEVEQGRTTRAITDYRNAASKIKSLLDKDKIRFMQKQKEETFQQGFKKYQYSEQNQMQESSMSEESSKAKEESNRQTYEEKTYNQHYHSSFQVSNQPSHLPSNHPSSKKTSSKKQLQRSKKEVSSKLEVSGQNSKNNSLEGRLKFRVSEKESSRRQPEDEQSDEIISNSSSFSQFSISGSNKRDVGKISRKMNSLDS